MLFSFAYMSPCNYCTLNMQFFENHFKVLCNWYALLTLLKYCLYPCILNIDLKNTTTIINPWWKCQHLRYGGRVMGIGGGGKGNSQGKHI